MIYWLIYVVILIVGIVGLITAFQFVQRKTKSGFANIIISVLALFVVFMGIEFYFKLFFVQSDGFRYTLASQNWYDKYWQENSLGYRDVEWTPERLKSKTKLMVVGDSFVAGSGIANPEDRFANQLGQLLGDNYAILNVASPGWDTIDEVDAIIQYPYKPDLLVLSYYINDIEGVAYNSGAQRPQVRQDPPRWLSPLIRNSYAINFLYWRLIRLGPQEWAEIYWNDWLKRISADDEIRWRHRQELLTIIEGAKAQQISLFVVIFPNLAAVEESRFMTQPVIDLFESQNVPVLDVGKILAGRNPATTMVNAIDSHPNEQINLEVAQHLHQIIMDNLK